MAKKDIIGTIASGAYKEGKKAGKKLEKVKTKKILQMKRRQLKPTRVLEPQQKVLSKEQTLLSRMFGGSFGQPVLLDRPGQFFDGSEFPVTRPIDSNTAAMFGGQGFDTKKFFLPNKFRRARI